MVDIILLTFTVCVFTGGIYVGKTYGGFTAWIRAVRTHIKGYF